MSDLPAGQIGGGPPLKNHAIDIIWKGREHIQPRGLRREAAAAFLRMAPKVFDRKVEHGSLSKPFDGLVWDRKRLMRDIGIDSQIYFIRCGEFVKIGYASGFNGIEKRMGGIMTANPFQFRLLNAEIGGRTEESMVHERFRLHRHRREWFYLEGELFAYLKKIADIWAPQLQ